MAKRRTTRSSATVTTPVTVVGNPAAEVATAQPSVISSASDSVVSLNMAQLQSSGAQTLNIHVHMPPPRRRRKVRISVADVGLQITGPAAIPESSVEHAVASTSTDPSSPVSTRSRKRGAASNEDDVSVEIKKAKISTETKDIQTDEYPITPRVPEKLASDIEHTMQCSICQEILFDAVSIHPCGHNFCSGCISRWLSRSQPNALCPTCRKNVVSAAGNTQINALVDSYLDFCPEKRRSGDDIAANAEHNIITNQRDGYRYFGTNEANYSDISDEEEDPGWNRWYDPVSDSSVYEMEMGMRPYSPISSNEDSSLTEQDFPPTTSTPRHSFQVISDSSTGLFAASSDEDDDNELYLPALRPRASFVEAVDDEGVMLGNVTMSSLPWSDDDNLSAILSGADEPEVIGSDAPSNMSDDSSDDMSDLAVDRETGEQGGEESSSRRHRSRRSSRSSNADLVTPTSIVRWDYSSPESSPVRASHSNAGTSSQDYQSGVESDGGSSPSSPARSLSPPPAQPRRGRTTQRSNFDRLAFEERRNERFLLFEEPRTSRRCSSPRRR